jgi:hypothetical protein
MSAPHGVVSGGDDNVVVESNPAAKTGSGSQAHSIPRAGPNWHSNCVTRTMSGRGPAIAALLGETGCNPVRYVAAAR